MLPLPGFYALCLCSLLCLSVSAQTTSSKPVAERMYVCMDKPWYATGETIWYTVYFPDTASLQSHVLYVDLISPAGEVVVHQKLRRKQFYAYGDMVIPADWEEGYYLLRCYTHWNLNFGKEAIYNRYIAVYNTWHEGSAVATTTVLPNAREPAAVPEGLKIRIQPEQEVYGNGDSVKLIISVTDAQNKPVKASLSLSVLDASLFPATAYHPERPAVPSTPAIVSVPLKFPAEKALKLQLELRSTATSEPVNSQFISVYNVEERKFINTSVTQGRLSIPFADFYGYRTFQVHNHNPFQLALPQVAVNDVLTLLPPPALLSEAPPFTPEVQRYLQLKRLRYKLQEIFAADTLPYIRDTLSVPSLLPDKTYRIENFQLLKNIEEFIDHVFTKVRISSREGKKMVQLFDPVAQRFMEDSPWYLVNGYLTTEQEAVLAMPLNTVEKMEVFLQKNTLVQQFPPLMLRSGVLAIDTKDKATPTSLLSEQNTFRWQGFYQPRPFMTTGIPQVANERYPDFRPLVFWEPALQTSPQGKAVIIFPSSRAVGQFLIQVEGFSAGGAYGSAQHVYKTVFND